jgi:2'-5' RNA ligase
MAMTALTLIPDTAAWPMIQLLRKDHDKQVRNWPPHINILYPFVPREELDDAAHMLAAALMHIRPLRLKFSRLDRFGSTAFLVPEDMDEPGCLASIHAACKVAFPNLQQTREEWQPHLTIGQFKSEEACIEFINACPLLHVTTEIAGVAMLTRDTIQRPFCTAFTVRFGWDLSDATAVVENGKMQQYIFQSTQNDIQKIRQNFHQVDDSFVRLVFSAEADEVECSRVCSDKLQKSRCTLFVIDRSASMGCAYAEVKSAVRYMMKESAGKVKIDFILYNERARKASPEDVLNSFPDGMTSFVAAFAAIRSYVMAQPEGSSINVVFMTDGQDTASKNLPGAQGVFADLLRTCKRTVVIHTIGFTAGHEQELLEELRLMGNSDGTYRYAGESEDLESRFTEMFDFLELNVRKKVLIDEAEFTCDAESHGDGRLHFDVLLRREQLDNRCFAGESPRHVVVGDEELLLERAKIDQNFFIHVVNEMSIKSLRDLEVAQRLLSGIHPQKVPKWERQEAIYAKQEAQDRLDKYHQIFARGVRTGVAAAGSENLAAELGSLRHEIVFSKARRARAMAQRTTANGHAVHLMDQILKRLPPVKDAELSALEEQELCCSLSGQTVVDVMQSSDRDFFVFTLRVRRSETVIDAPTSLEVMRVLSGTYSNEAFQAGTAHAINMVGADRAHGGFASSTLGEDVGLFRGPDGQMMNACLPLYLDESHFRRVRVQIKPILGYFFTLDPLGYKGDQIIAMFGILGTMLCWRATADGLVTSASASSELSQGMFHGAWADWIINDFTKLCESIRPIAMEYLHAGGYTGVARGDILEDFLASPAGRTKDKLPTLAILVGWAHTLNMIPSHRFRIAFVEELWRRNFTVLQKGQPREPFIEVLERLLYGPGAAVSVSSEKPVREVGVAKIKSFKDKEFALWARYRWGDLNKRDSENIRKRFPKRIGIAGEVEGPEIDNLLCADAEYSERRALRYDEAPDFFDAEMAQLLKSISYANKFTAPLYEDCSLGKGFTPHEKRLMLIQALQFSANDLMNEGVTSGRYLDTVDCLNYGEEGAQLILQPLHERFEHHRRQKWSAYVEHRNALLTAKHIVATENLEAFAGRCFVSCPTRGGLVFDCVVGLLVVGSIDGTRICNLNSKITAIMTGKIDDKPVIAAGTSWIHCPMETARRFQDLLGEEEFARIEIMMYGTWGHVYRASDLPNRHGHSNSNPNPDLVQDFSGFRFG